MIGQEMTTSVAAVGFDRETTAKVHQELERAGWRVTSFIKSAEVLILGPAADAALARDPRSMRWEDWQQRYGRDRRPQPAVVCEDERVRVLDIELPRRPEPGRLVPPAERFRELCFDHGFLTCARHAALAVQQGLPLLFEGPTGTAKTTAILWLAYLCRQDVVRLNLNGQTDTGELVGRFLPVADSCGKLGWRFGEGTIPQALRHGWWVLLDEINLAEPQVAERLNPVLEQPPTLVLSEHDGTRFGPGGDVPVHPAFRMFATMNPSEYAGRSLLSPAFRDRWSLWIHVPPVSKVQIYAMLRRLVHGVHPEVVWQGLTYRMPDEAPVYPSLAELNDEALQQVAHLHDVLTTAAGGVGDEPAALGRTRRERYVFTRRTLLTALRLAARDAAAGTAPIKALGQALRLVYIERLVDESERAAALSMLRASGFAV